MDPGEVLRAWKEQLYLPQDFYEYCRVNYGKEAPQARRVVVQELHQSGLKSQEIAVAVGSGYSTICEDLKILATGTGYRKKGEKNKQVEDAPIDWNTIPGNQQEKLARAKTSIRKELEKEFHIRLLAELDQYRAELDSNFATHKSAYDAQNQRINAMRDDERRRYQEGIEVYKAKGLITPNEYDLVRSCLHPDSRNSASDEKLASAFRLFNDSRIRTLLVKEK